MQTEIIRKTIMFSAFSDNELKHLPEMLCKVQLDNEEVLFQQGQKFQNFYYVSDGIIKLSRLSEDGSEKVVELIRPGHFFAEALVFLNSPAYPVMATSMGKSQVVAVSAEKYSSLLSNSISACFNLLGAMSQRIHGLVKDIDALTLHSSRSRLADYLLDCLKYFTGDTIKLELPKGVIASRLSMKPETFSRALHGLEQSGVISIEKRLIQILDKQKLSEIAHQEQERQ